MLKKLIFYALLGSFLLPFNEGFGFSSFQSSHTQGLCFVLDSVHVVQIGRPEEKTYAIALGKEVKGVQGSFLDEATLKLYLLVALNDEQSQNYWESDLSTIMANFKQSMKESPDHPLIMRCEQREGLFYRIWYALFEDRTSIEAFSSDCSAQWISLSEDLMKVGKVSFPKEPPAELIESQKSFDSTVGTIKEELVSLEEEAKFLLPVADFVKTYGDNGSFIEFLDYENNTASNE